MTDKEKAIKLLDRIPEGKMDYILGVLEGAAISDGEYDRKSELLIAAYKLLNKQNKSSYVLNMLSETVYYDEAECDGNCLLEDIESCLYESGIDVAEMK